MQPIHSGSSTERILRAAVVAVLINAFAVWFLWDGYRGYPLDNARTLAASLGRGDSNALRVDWDLTREAAKRRKGDVSPGMAGPALEERLGSPAFRVDSEWYYVGPGGHLRVNFENGRVREVEWLDGRHSDTDLAWQRWIGFTLLVPGLIALVYFVRVCVTRVSLTPAGLRVAGHGVIPMDAILDVRDSDAASSVVVEYGRDGDRHAVVLDRYHVRDLEAIVTALRQQLAAPDRGQTGRRDGIN